MLSCTPKRVSGHQDLCGSLIASSTRFLVRVHRPDLQYAHRAAIHHLDQSDCLLATFVLRPRDKHPQRFRAAAVTFIKRRWRELNSDLSAPCLTAKTTSGRSDCRSSGNIVHYLHWPLMRRRPAWLTRSPQHYSRRYDLRTTLRRFPSSISERHIVVQRLT